MEAWLDITPLGSPKARYQLLSGLMRVGSGEAEIPLEGTDGDQLHFWSDPAKVILIGGRTTPLFNGRAFEESSLEPGDSLQWCGAVIVYGAKANILQEIAHEPAPAPKPVEQVQPKPAAAPLAGAASASVAAGASGGELWSRLKAGLLVDLGMADKGEAKRWQEAVKRGEFDASACSRDILSSCDVPDSDPRLRERANRLQRDLLMSPLVRGIQGTSRRARSAAKGGAAMIVSQGIGIGIYTLLIVVIAVFARINYDTDFTGMIDGFLNLLSGGEE
jgi:hypothetical protein